MTSDAIADTGPLVAFLDRGERNHAWAVERERRRHEHVAACDAILRRRNKLPRVSVAAVRRAREEVRR